MTWPIRLLIGLLGLIYLGAGVAALFIMGRLMAPTVRFIRSAIRKSREET